MWTLLFLFWSTRPSQQQMPARTCGWPSPTHSPRTTPPAGCRCLGSQSDCSMWDAGMLWHLTTDMLEIEPESALGESASLAACGQFQAWAGVAASGGWSRGTSTPFPAPLRTAVRQRVGRSSGANPSYPSRRPPGPRQLLFGGGVPHPCVPTLVSLAGGGGDGAHVSSSQDSSGGRVNSVVGGTERGTLHSLGWVPREQNLRQGHGHRWVVMVRLQEAGGKDKLVKDVLGVQPLGTPRSHKD